MQMVVRIYRQRWEHNAQCYVHQLERFIGSSVIVWVAFTGREILRVIIRRNGTAHEYRDQVLVPALVHIFMPIA